MFKNLTLYRYSGAPVDAVCEALRFLPTLPTQLLSIGLVPPREPGAPLFESNLLCVQIQTRSVPTPAVAKAVDAMAAEAERQTGRKPGRKQRAGLKDEVLLDLLPRAFPKDCKVLAWLAPDGLLVLDTASAGRAEETVTLLTQGLGLIVTPVASGLSPATLMTAWLHDGSPDWEEFSLANSCELKAPSGGKAVRYTSTDLDVP